MLGGLLLISGLAVGAVYLARYVRGGGASVVTFRLAPMPYGGNRVAPGDL